MVISEVGGTVVVGASGKDAYGEDHGAAYVFVRSEAGWADVVETAKLSASGGTRNDFFGASLAISTGGDRVVVGATWTCPHSGGVGGSLRVHQGQRRVEGRCGDN